MGTSLIEQYVKRILSANVYDLARETPLENMQNISRKLNNSIWVKREDTQPVFSFKVRGAYNKIRLLSEEEKAKGILTVSAGNHAQGVAISAKKLGIKATIVMPKTIPETKLQAVINYGAKTILYGDNIAETFPYGLDIAKGKSLTFIPPYDDPDIIAGQGTIAIEIMRQAINTPDVIFVPVGGGGLLAGITSYIKYLYPKVKIIGVEPNDSNALKQSMDAGKRVKLKSVGLFADGVAVNQIGVEPFKIIKKNIDGVICVSSDEICAAVKDAFDDNRAICEPSGAIALAGLKKYVNQNQIKNQSLIAVISGANTTFERLGHVAERAEIGEQKEAILAVTLKEQAGSFLSFCKLLKDRTITEFNYRCTNKEEGKVFAGIRLRDNDTSDTLSKELISHGYKVIDMTNNSMAKTHVRHMVGGHGPSCLENERVFRVTFPERPRALLDFLKELGKKWNISLFHYRNHGAAYGRALVGIQVLDKEISSLHDNLDATGYEYSIEQDNPAYKCFLK